MVKDKILKSLITIILLVMMGSCFSKYPDVIITRKLKPLKYTNFYTAMRNLDFSYLDDNRVTEDQGTFAEGLKLILDRKIIESQQLLQQLLDKTGDNQLKNYIQFILSKIYFYQSNWRGMIELAEIVPISKSEKKVIKITGNTLLATSFIGLPSEEYVFSRDETELPLYLSGSDTPMIEVEINGVKRKFWLDTGSGISIIASDVAEECGIDRLGVETAIAHTATTKRVNFSPAVVESLKMGDIEIKNHRVMILDEDDLKLNYLFFNILKIDGILGWPVISRMRVEIDYNGMKVRLSKPIDRITPEENLFWLGSPYVFIEGKDGLKLVFKIDTGATTSSLTYNYFRKLRIRRFKMENRRIGSAGGWDTFLVEVLENTTLYHKDYKMTWEDISTRPIKENAFIYHDGVLGSDISRQGKMIIDYNNGKFEIDIPETRE